ncbi:MAG: extracellular solute-binding protein [Acidimicrobiales bacterium]
MTTLVNRFNASHKSVRVTIVVTKASTKLLAAIPAGNAPVLAEISHYDGVYVKAGALVSWNSFLKNSSVVSAKSFVPVAWKNGDVGRQHYRLEADIKVSQVLYNEKMFRQVGITSPPETWTELAADAAVIKAKLPGVIPLGWKNSSAHELPAFMSDGGTLLKGSNSVGRSVNFDTAAGMESFSYFRTLFSSGEMEIHHGTTLREDFAAGKMAMIDGTSAGYAKALAAVSGRFPVGAFVEPAGSTGHAANLAQGLGFVLPKGHSHAQDEAAWTFVQWWFGAAQQAYWAMQTGFAPETHAGITAVPASYLASHPGLVTTIQAAESPYTVPRPVSDSYNEVQAALDTAWFNAVTGKQSVSSALQALQKQGNSYMAGASEI